MQGNHNLTRIFNDMFETTADKITVAVAAGAAVYPAWRDNLHDIAVVCGDIAQPIALLWLVVQLSSWFLRTFFPEPGSK